MRGGWRLLVVAVLLVPACAETGTATTYIGDAETEIEQLADEIVQAIALEVTREEPLRSRSRCQLPTGDGASNSLSRRGPIPATDDPVGRAAGILLAAGYELVDSPDLGEGVFGRRDGIRVTVLVDAPTAQLAIDANTGCRPLDRR